MIAKSALQNIYSFFSSIVGASRHADPVRSDVNSRSLGSKGLQKHRIIPFFRDSVNDDPKDFTNNSDSPNVRLCNNYKEYSENLNDRSEVNEFESENRNSNYSMKVLGSHGISPPPPVSDSWRRIDRWADQYYHELWCQLSYPATEDDVLVLETLLGYSMPQDVKESFYVHDGQDRGGYPTGIIFGLVLLDIEEVIEERNIWKKVADIHSSMIYNKKLSNRFSKKQRSYPHGAVQALYAHPAWIPLAKDYGGNNIGVDLAPGPNGRWGQVIIFGRDQDIKYVIAKSWSAFLASVADDLEGERWAIDEETGALTLLSGDNDFPKTYLEILKSRYHKEVDYHHRAIY